MKKIDFYREIQNELGVIMAFSKIHEELGFTKLIPSSTRGFDIDSIDYRGKDVTLEFEYYSSNFINHDHHSQMEDSKKYIVVCWSDDCGLVSTLKSKYGKDIEELIEMKKYVKIRKHNFSSKSVDDPKYIILSYNQDYAGGKDFSAWSFVNCYRVRTSKKIPKFASDKLPLGSKILIYHKGYVIGGFTVVRYEIIEKPRTPKEWCIYKKLTDYPASLFEVSIEEYEQNYLRGHIFYADFFDLRDFKIKLSLHIKKKMSHHGKLNITKEEYYRIIGH